MLQEYRGPDNKLGYDKVQRLARYLVSLRQKLALSQAEVERIRLLHRDLDEGDKVPAVCSERVRKAGNTGSFRRVKGKNTAVSGLQVARK